MSPVSRGFRHLRRASDEDSGRVPPGQYVTEGFPVLSAGPAPHTPLEKCTFSILRTGRRGSPGPGTNSRRCRPRPSPHIHCVTRWSKLGTEWRGVSVDTLPDQGGYDAPYVMALCDGGTPRTCRSPTSAAVRRGWPSATTAARWRPSTAARPGRLSSRPRPWQAATVASVTWETASVVTIELDPPHWLGHRAGQHLDVRLTAEDGYTAEREYSIASAPGEPVAITVERLACARAATSRRPCCTPPAGAGADRAVRGTGGH